MSNSQPDRSRISRGVRGGGRFDTERAGEPTPKVPLSNSAAEEVGTEAPRPGGTWILDVLYNGQWPETIAGNHTGLLPKPHRSDSLFLTELLGFKSSLQLTSIDTNLAAALEEPTSVIGHFPVFMTTEDAPTTVRGVITNFSVTA